MERVHVLFDKKHVVELESIQFQAASTEYRCLPYDDADNGRINLPESLSAVISRDSKE